MKPDPTPPVWTPKSPIAPDEDEMVTTAALTLAATATTGSVPLLEAAPDAAEAVALLGVALADGQAEGLATDGRPPRRATVRIDAAKLETTEVARTGPRRRIAGGLSSITGMCIAVV